MGGPSLRSWRDFARECFCFGSEAVNTSGEAITRGFAAREFSRGLRQGGNMATLPLARSRIPPATRIPSRASPGREYGGSAARPLMNPASYAG